MEYIKKIFKKSGWISILESVIFLILGFILICFPEGSVNFITTVLAIIFIIIGIFKVINYIASKGNSDFYNFDLIYGIIAIVIGIIVIIFRSTLISVLRIVIGIWIMYSALIILNSSLKLKQIAHDVWVPSLILAIIMFICGLFIALNSGTVVITIGIIIVVYSIIDIIESIIFMKNVKDIF